MPCVWTPITDEDGKVVGHAHVRMSGRRRVRCAYCPEWHTVLCDGPVPAGENRRRALDDKGDTTCSRPLCQRHAIHVAPDSDFCRDPRCVAAAKAAAIARGRAQEA